MPILCYNILAYTSLYLAILTAAIYAVLRHDKSP